MTQHRPPQRHPNYHRFVEVPDVDYCGDCSQPRYASVHDVQRHPDLDEFDNAVADHEAAKYGGNVTITDEVRAEGHEIAPKADGDIFDATATPGVTQLPAVQTNFTPEQFQAWIASEGEMFVVYLPDNKSFIIKVPDPHNAFFVAMMQQVRFCLGSSVQAVRMHMVTGPPADVDAEPVAPATGTANEAPQWAQPQGGES